MNIKHGIFLMAVLFVFASVHATEVQNQQILVAIDSEGKAVFSERFNLIMDRWETIDFLDDVEENGKNLAKWKEKYDFIFPHFADAKDITTLNISFESQTKSLLLTYETGKRFAIAQEESRTSEFVIPDSVFEKFISATLINIPKSTEIILALPEKATVNVSALSSGIKYTEQTHLITIQGFNGSNVGISYSLPKPIAPPLSTQELLEDFFESKFNQSLLILLIGAIVGILIFRQPLSEAIEVYIVEHSEFERQDIDEEA